MGDCQCLRCATERGDGTMIGDVFIPAEMSRMFLCAICGNKRCPHSDDHRNACTNSNDSGQVGSRYGIPDTRKALGAGE